LANQDLLKSLLFKANRLSQLAKVSEKKSKKQVFPFENCKI